MDHRHHVQVSNGSLQAVLDWFAGNGAYHNLVHCMGQDYLWIWVTIALDLAVAAGYMLIAKHWWANQRLLPESPARRALANMRNIFLFCGICGYLFIPIKMIWPAWRLYDLFMVALVYFTWRYAWGATDLKVIYSELGKGSRLAEELETSREESRHKTFFLNAVSHDLRTPLNGLMLQANIAELSADSGDTAALRSALRDMKASARATSDLLDTLLEYARPDEAEPQHVTAFCLRDLLSEVCSTHRPSAQAVKLTLEVDCPPGLTITTERIKLERALSNLVGNSVKFTRTGGIRVEAVQSGRRVEVHVTDTGIGIAAADRGRLFEEFFQVNNNERDRRKGFGLGLAITRRLIRQLGGDISVDSTPGEGSRFTVALPGVAQPPGRRSSTGAGPAHKAAVAAD